MKINFLNSLLAICFALAFLIGATAQPEAQGFGRDDSGSLGNLQVGMQLPDVSLYDSDGNTFHLTQLKGSYSVLVFGCLT